MIWHLRFRKIICLLLVFTCSYIQPQESKATGGDVRAFPEASGYGAGTVGGRGGRVIFVDNLNDAGAGSLREALEAADARIVIFRTAGVITLKSTIIVDDPYLTVAGQTAPSPGITLRMHPSSASTFNAKSELLVAAKDLICIRTHDVVMRYLKLRRGDTKISGRNLVIQTDNGSQFAHDVIIDHMSFSWSTDESVDIYTSETLDPNLDQEHTYGINNGTISNSIIAESLAQDCFNWLNPDPDATHLSQPIPGHVIGDPSKLLTKTLNTDFDVAQCVDKENGQYLFNNKGKPIMKANIHPLGMVIGGYTEKLSWHKVKAIDLHHNLFAHNTHRNPRVKAHGIKIVNNYIYNWFTRASETMLSTQADYIGNIFQHGPLSSFQPVPPSDPLFTPGNEELVPNVTTGKVYRTRFLFHDFVGKVLDPVTKILVPISPDEGLGSLYLSENIAPAITSMWDAINNNWSMLLDQQQGISLSEVNKRKDFLPLPDARFPIRYTIPTMANKLDLMKDVGANKRLLCNGSWVNATDFVDERVIKEASQLVPTTIDTVTAIYKTAREAGPLVQKPGKEGRFYLGRPDPYSATDPYAPFNPVALVLTCADSDVVKDGMPDAWEQKYGRNFIANEDTDNDGYTNIEEYINGSDPLNIADLSLQLIVNKPTIKNNPDIVIVALRVINLGPSKAYAVKTSLPVPATMQVASLPAACTLSNGLITCNNNSIVSDNDKVQSIEFKTLSPITALRDVYFQNARVWSEASNPSQLTFDKKSTNNSPAGVMVTCIPGP